MTGQILENIIQIVLWYENSFCIDCLFRNVISIFPVCAHGRV